ncbi:MAG: ATP-binding protein [Bacteroidota bacterium]
MNDTKAMPFLERQIKLKSHPDQIRSVENIVDELKNELAFKEDAYANIMIAVTEAVNNGITHGNKSDPQKWVHVGFEAKIPYRLVVTVKDEGEGFDPNTLADPTSPENIENIGGRGVFLMRHLADELNFLDEGRKVEMVFNI